MISFAESQELASLNENEVNEELYQVIVEEGQMNNDNEEGEMKKKQKKKKKKDKFNPYKIEFVTQEPQDRVTYAFDFKNEISKFSRSKFNSNGHYQKPNNPFDSSNSGLRILQPIKSTKVLICTLLFIMLR